MNATSIARLTALSAILLCCGQEQDDAAAKKQKTIRELLDQTGAGKLGTQVMAQMGELMGKSMPGEFGEFWKGFSSQVDVAELEGLIIPIYAKYFSQEDLEGMIQFNKTPLGQKVIRTMPDVVKESMAAGAEWGRGVATKAMERFQEKKK